MASALRVAARLAVTELTMGAYEQARAQINAEAERRHRHGAQIKPLPSVDTISKGIGWPQALAAARLAQDKSGKRRRPMPRAEVVSLFVAHCGFVPSKVELRWFGKHHRIALASQTAADPHQAAVEAARAQAAQAGRWFPPGRPRPLPDDCKARAGEPSAGIIDAAER